MEQLKRAITIREEIAALEKELNQIMASVEGGVKGKISPEGRARIAAAQRARWAREKGQVQKSPVLPKSRKTLSAEARKKIAESARARWARMKAEKGQEAAK